MQSYGPPNLGEFRLGEFQDSHLGESQLGEFQDSHLGVPGQNAIWIWASWKGTKYNIRGKVVTPPKSGP
jgi:hypothetical protein